MKQYRIKIKSLLGLAVAVMVLGGFFPCNEPMTHAAEPSTVQFDLQSDKRVNINNAGPEELIEIHGVGPVLAERIVAYRDEFGPFKQIDDLAEVRGIGTAKLEKIRSQIKV